MNRTRTNPRALAARINPDAHGDKGVGGQIDWSRVGAYFYNVGKFTVKLAEAVSKGETAIDVDALPYPLKKGANLDFGAYESVLVTTTAQAAAAATSIAVAALSAKIPAGAVLNFTGAGEFAVLTAEAAEGATSLDVEALDAQIESGDTATFEGGAINLEVKADAEAGATSITVEPAPFDIADDTEAIATQSGSTGRKIPAGTVMARTSAKKLIPRADADAETAVEILVSDADEESMSDAKTGYGTYKAGGFYENLLPDAGTNGASAGDLPSAWKTELGVRFWFTAGG